MKNGATGPAYITGFALDEPSLEGYREKGGYQALEKVLGGSPEQVIETVRGSGLRGRGGAGFPTGLKWDSVPRDGATGEPIVVCNADEGEPGTFKDRYIMRSAPHLMLEGMTIAAFAIGASRGYIYIRGEYPEIAERLLSAMRRAREQNLLGEDIMGSGFSFDLELRRGGGSYVVGDETALLSSLMGRRGFPWMKPPYPTERGAWDLPTVVNNVETLAYVPMVITEGAESFASIGPERSPGLKLYCVSGHVEKPGVYEMPMGITAEELLAAAGGVRGSLKALQIGGSAGPIYPARALGFHLDYDSMKEEGGTLGSGAVVAMNAKTSMVGVLEVTMRFFAEESCGQCFPCRYGTRQLEYMASNIAKGEGKTSYLQLMEKTAEVMDASSFCPFGQSLALPLKTLFESFGDEIEGYIREHDYMTKVV